MHAVPHSFPRAARLAAALSLQLGAAVALGGAAAAQVPLSGNVYDGSGGPLVSGTIYHSTAGFTVPAGQTLTVPGNVVIKLTGQVSVQGQLDVLATAGSPTFFTSKQDDALGGDTFGDGATVGAPNQWQGVVVQSTGGVNLHHADLRHAGAGGWRAVYGNGGAIGLFDCSIHDNGGPGVDLNGFDVPTVIERCAIDGNGGWAIYDARIERVPAFLDNTASGNADGDAVRVVSGTVTVDTTIAAENLIDGVLVLPNHMTVLAGVTWTQAAGTALKWATGNLFVDGAFRALGAEGDPVVLTALEDDEHHGDTENDGLTSGAPSAWAGIVSRLGGEIEIEHAVLRYAGAGGWRAIYGAGGTVAVRHARIHDNTGPGIDLNGHDVPTVIERCAIDDNGGWAIYDAPIVRVPSFLDNTGSGNADGDAIRVVAGLVTVDTAIAAENLIDGVLVLPSDMTVPAGVTWTQAAGTALKWATGNLFVDGTFRALGAEGDPVVLTALEDDEHHGDTENDGPTSGAPSAWAGIVSRLGGEIEIEHAVLRYAGAGGWRAIYGAGGTVAVRHARIHDNTGPGIDLNLWDVDTEVVDCDIDDNSDVAVDDVPLHRLVGFDSNRAQGNAGGNYVQAPGQTLVADAVVTRRNLIGDVLVVASTVTVPVGRTLTLRPGVVCKLATGLFTVGGTLVVAGTGIEPVVITALEDDAILGDTNLDGPSTGSPGAWSGIRLQSTSTLSSLEHAILRYHGGGGWDGLRIDLFATVARLDSVRAEHGSSNGFRLRAPGATATNLVAFQNGNDGIVLETDFHLVHATSVQNGFAGVRSTVGGMVTSSIAWGNFPNFTGFPPTALTACDGDPAAAGTQGNLFVDPMLVDAPNGDLRLAPGSPVVGAGSLATALGVVTDFDAGSRIVRATSGGPVTPDMGAYEQVRWTLAASGSAAIGETLTLAVGGEPGLALYAWGFLDGTLFLSPYGFLLCGTLSATVLGPPLAVGAPVPLPVPDNPLFVGVGLGFQGFGVNPLDPNTAHLTNVARVELEPALP
jgi:hypothetical protein